jgi:protein gp37
MGKTKIEWCDRVWNPTTGCMKISQGCKNCYAERIYERFHPGQSFGIVRALPGRLDQPLRWRKPARVFVDSMSDLFHPDVPDEFIFKVWMVMSSVRRHAFIVLTKRPQRMLELIGSWQSRHWLLPHVWLGVSVEDQKTADERIPLLLQTPAAVRFVSYEPALGPIETTNHFFGRYFIVDGPPEPGMFGPEMHSLPKVDWVIMGCESGPGRRPMDLTWARSMRDQCIAAKVLFFLKQAEIDGKLVKMPFLDDKQWAEYPGAK